MNRALYTNENQFEDLVMKLARMDGELFVKKMDTPKRYDGRMSVWP
jgi:hypothetical protein